MIDPNKKEQLVEKIQLLMKSKNRKNIGQRGKEIVQEKFNLKTMADNYSNIYRKLSVERNTNRFIF